RDEAPRFCPVSWGTRSLPRVVDGAAAAALIRTHAGLGLGSGMLVCVPVPAPEALPDGEARGAIDRAIGDADAATIAGPELTPWLLARIAVLTGGAAVRANTALIVNN